MEPRQRSKQPVNFARRWGRRCFFGAAQRFALHCHCWRRFVLWNTYDMGVSWNCGTPKSSMFMEFSTINHPLGGSPIYGNSHILWYPLIERGCARLAESPWLSRPDAMGMMSRPGRTPIRCCFNCQDDVKGYHVIIWGRPDAEPHLQTPVLQEFISVTDQASRWRSPNSKCPSESSLVKTTRSTSAKVMQKWHFRWNAVRTLCQDLSIETHPPYGTEHRRWWTPRSSPHRETHLPRSKSEATTLGCLKNHITPWISHFLGVTHV